MNKNWLHHIIKAMTFTMITLLVFGCAMFPVMGQSNNQSGQNINIEAVEFSPPDEPPIVGNIVPGDSLAEKLAWLERSADSHNTYILEASSDENISPQTFEYKGAINITIALRGDDVNRTIKLKSNGTMFTVKSNVIFILDNNITLHGHDKNSGSMVVVDGGTFKMRTGSTITGNNTSRNGGGVFLQGYFNDGGTKFEMTGGTIRDNTAREGGGVYAGGGKAPFIMMGGIISGNTADTGGGVYASNDGGSFTMRGGTITGNTAREYGGGVFGGDGALTLVKGGGIITGFNSEQSNGNVVKDQFGNVLARRGHAVYVSADLRKETTAGPKENLSSDWLSKVRVSGAWDR